MAITEYIDERKLQYIPKQKKPFYAKLWQTTKVFRWNKTAGLQLFLAPIHTKFDRTTGQHQQKK